MCYGQDPNMPTEKEFEPIIYTDDRLPPSRAFKEVRAAPPHCVCEMKPT